MIEILYVFTVILLVVTVKDFSEMLAQNKKYYKRKTIYKPIFATIFMILGSGYFIISDLIYVELTPKLIAAMILSAVGVAITFYAFMGIKQMRYLTRAILATVTIIVYSRIYIVPLLWILPIIPIFIVAIIHLNGPIAKKTIPLPRIVLSCILAIGAAIIFGIADILSYQQPHVSLLIRLWTEEAILIVIWFAHGWIIKKFDNNKHSNNNIKQEKSFLPKPLDLLALFVVLALSGFVAMYRLYESLDPIIYPIFKWIEVIGALIALPLKNKVRPAVKKYKANKKNGGEKK